MLKVNEFTETFAASGKRFAHDGLFAFVVYETSDGPVLRFSSLYKIMLFGSVINECHFGGYCAFIDWDVMRRQVGRLLRRYELGRFRNKPQRICLFLRGNPLRYFGMIGQGWPRSSRGVPGYQTRLMFFNDYEQRENLVTLFVDGFDSCVIHMGLLFQLQKWLVTLSEKSNVGDITTPNDGTVG